MARTGAKINEYAREQAEEALRDLQRYAEVEAAPRARPLLRHAQEALGEVLGLRCTRQGPRCPIHGWLEPSDQSGVIAEYGPGRGAAMLPLVNLGERSTLKRALKRHETATRKRDGADADVSVVLLRRLGGHRDTVGT